MSAIALSATVSQAVDARMARWHGDAKGAVSFFYDDGIECQLELVIPTLAANGVPGTFYLCPGWYEGQEAYVERWKDAAAKNPGIVYLGDHTWSHGNVGDFAAMTNEIGRASAVIRKWAGLPDGALLSFALPGATTWEKQPRLGELEFALARYGNVLRHDFGSNIAGPGNPPFTVNTAQKAVEAVLDRAEREGSWQSLIFHGVGGGWIVFPNDEHVKLIEETSSRAAAKRIWAGAAIDVHKYETERENASCKLMENADGSMELAIKAESDPAKYDFPLTVALSVPDDVKSVTVGGRAATLENGGALVDLPPVTAVHSVVFGR